MNIILLFTVFLNSTINQRLFYARLIPNPDTIIDLTGTFFILCYLFITYSLFLKSLLADSIIHPLIQPMNNHKGLILAFSPAFNCASGIPIMLSLCLFRSTTKPDLKFMDFFFFLFLFFKYQSILFGQQIWQFLTHWCYRPVVNNSKVFTMYIWYCKVLWQMISLQHDVTQEFFYRKV